MAFTIDDEVFTSHYQIEDSLITFWGLFGIVLHSTVFPIFKNRHYSDNYYVTRTVLDQRLINATEFRLVLDITINRGEEDEEPFFAELVLTPTDEIPTNAPMQRAGRLPCHGNRYLLRPHLCCHRFV